MSINTWEYKEKNVDESINQNDFLSASRVIIYAAPGIGRSRDNSYANFKKIGLIQGYNWGEQKQIDQIFELGSEVSYLIPGRTAGQISLSRILLNGHDLLNVLYGTSSADSNDWIKSLKDIDKPLNLLFASYGNVNSSDTAQMVYSRVFQGCHITSRNESIAAGQTVVAENVNIMYTQIIGLDNTYAK